MRAPLRGKLIGGFLLVFVAGAIAGAFLGAAESRHHHMVNAHRSVVEKVRSRVQSRLELTPEQMKKAEPAVDNAARQLEEIRSETGRRVQKIFAEADRDIAPQLTDAQRAKMKELEAQQKSRAGQDGEGH